MRVEDGQQWGKSGKGAVTCWIQAGEGRKVGMLGAALLPIDTRTILASSKELRLTRKYSSWSHSVCPGM